MSELARHFLFSTVTALPPLMAFPTDPRLRPDGGLVWGMEHGDGSDSSSSSGCLLFPGLLVAQDLIVIGGTSLQKQLDRLHRACSGLKTWTDSQFRPLDDHRHSGAREVSASEGESFRAHRTKLAFFNLAAQGDVSVGRCVQRSAGYRLAHASSKELGSTLISQNMVRGRENIAAGTIKKKRPVINAHSRP